MSRKKLPLTIIVFMVSAFLFAACGGSSEEGGQSTGTVSGQPTGTVSGQSTGTDCRAIIDSKCVKCHYKTRICDALGSKSKRSWQRTINFMVRQGADLSKEEQTLVVDCLSTMPKGSDIVCK